MYERTKLFLRISLLWFNLNRSKEIDDDAAIDNIKIL